MNSFGENLKKYRLALGLSQKEFGERIGLKQTTIANYENNVRFPKGDNLKKLAFLLNMSIDGLLIRHELNTTTGIDEILYEASQRKFIKALFDWDEYSALEIIKQLEKNTSNKLFIYEKVIRKSLYDIGELWSLGRLSVIQEHYATQVCQKAVTLLSHAIVLSSDGATSAICMTVNPEEHNLGVLIICEALRSIHIKAYYIGSKVPLTQLIDALIRYKINYLVLSISMKEHIDSLTNFITILRHERALDTLKIIIGGRAFDENSQLALSCGADIYAKDSFDLLEQLSLLKRSTS
jgi:MerR family transcriptional regulator, light-induced transcriptional regulator